ncbi:MAG: ATP-binding protein, partial [Actinomyces sp.]
MDWPFVGRAAEIRAARNALTGVPPRSVLVLGAAGVGKTSLARHLLTEMTARGRDARWVTASPATAPLPLGAFADLLPPDPP